MSITGSIPKHDSNIHVQTKNGSRKTIERKENTMNGSGQRTIPNVVFPFRSMISKSFSVADNGSEYQVRGNLAPDILHCGFAA